MAETKNGTDGTEEKTGNNKPNPFEQPPILQVLFQQLSVEDLAQCRLVNKVWYEESLSTFRSNATLKFEGGRITSKRNDGSNPIRLTLLEEFFDLWEAGEWASCPFKKLSFEGLPYFWGLKDTDYVEQKRFVELMGGHVTSLTLKDTCYDYYTVRWIIYQAFPNLQFLKIEGHWHWEGRRDDGYSDGGDGYPNDYLDYSDGEYEPPKKIFEYEEPEFGVHGLKSLELSSCNSRSLMDLLSHFHKLENLSLRRVYGYSVNGQEQYRKLLEVIKVIRAQDPTKLPLKNFDVEFGFISGQHDTDASMELLRLHQQLNLPLQRLKIWFYPEERMHPRFNNVIRDILRDHSETLKYLAFTRVYGNILCNSFPFGFNLEKLEKLVIRSPRFTDNLNYLKYTPNLRTLEIQDEDLTLFDSDILFFNSFQLEIGDWTLPALTELRFELPLSVWSLGKLMKWMPNVENLKVLEIDDVKFSMICKTWKNLKYLEDLGFELTDAGVLGIGNGFEADGDEETQIGTNISKLKNLISFKSAWSRLTSASLHDGFLKLANLKELVLGYLTKYNENEINRLKKNPYYNYGGGNDEW